MQHIQNFPPIPKVPSFENLSAGITTRVMAKNFEQRRRSSSIDVSDELLKLDRNDNVPANFWNSKNVSASKRN